MIQQLHTNSLSHLYNVFADKVQRLPVSG